MTPCFDPITGTITPAVALGASRWQPGQPYPPRAAGDRWFWGSGAEDPCDRPAPPPPPPVSYYLGLDLGQAHDYTALALVRRVAGAAPATPARYQVAALKRYRLGTPYPVIVDRVQRIIARLQRPNPGTVGPCPPFRTPHSPLRTPATLVVDATGVGPPVVDMFRRAGLEPIAVTITGGMSASQPAAREYHVPKRDLVSVLHVLLQSGRLKIAARLPEALVLHHELRNFRVRITAAANDIYAAWRENDHDDTVLAVALAAWAAERIVPRELWIY